MANVPHSGLTGTDLHESKGTAAATAGQVFIADGAGSGGYAKIPNTSLAASGNPFGAQLLHVREEKTNGTTATVFSGVNAARELNTVKTNEISGASLSSNQITLPAGTYYFSGSAPQNTGGAHRLTLQNITAGAALLVGPNAFFTMGAGDVTIAQTHASIAGRFTLAAPSVLELQHGQSGGSGRGRACSFGTAEIYAELMIWKIA